MDSESGHGLGLGLADSAIDQPVIFTNPNLVGKPSPNVADERHELHHSHNQNNYVHGQGLVSTYEAECIVVYLIHIR